MSMIYLKPFYLVRHGQTDFNLQKKAQGQDDNSLNRAGEQQAESIKNIINKLDIDIIYYSPLKRVVQTMEIASIGLNCKKIALDSIKECNFGNFEGSPAKNNVIELISQVGYNGELLQEYTDRIITGINNALSSDQVPLIFAHGGTYDILCHVMGIVDIMSIRNCEIVYFNPSKKIANSWIVSKVIG